MRPNTRSTPLATLLLAALAAASGMTSAAAIQAAPGADRFADTHADCSPPPCAYATLRAEQERRPDWPATGPAAAAGPAEGAAHAAAVQPIDSAAHTWLADRVLLLYRRTGLAEDERAAWLLENAGIDALIAEARAAGNATHARYYRVAIADPAADAERIERLLRAGLPDATPGRTAVLQAAAAWMSRQAEVDPHVLDAYIAATRGLAGTKAQRRMLAELMAVPALDERQRARVARAATATGERR